ncbi:porphobilinogen deaminase [Delitschia confertaspora ATCC 74209]|uniref:hydroxymethylbilane synthase n=1 Tax=Delitschia confertaspora ATCC 74209 TaxID=1513339 RepID=A0A9P4JF44_9PLEO|nr:porphobilinogen deaminase [Delitschia confertaspora ATCC 74209]
MASATETTLQTPSGPTPNTTTSSASTSFAPINIGTRRSLLAQVQARHVEKLLKDAFPDRTYNIVTVLAQGDKDKVTPLQQLSQGENAKSLWTGELEEMLEKRELDLIVHCLKDMPTQLPPHLSLGAILEREDPRDALVVSPKLPQCKTIASLPQGSTIGTSSVRRAAQLRRHYPHLRFADVRGNVGTRLSKLDAEDSPFAAIILAVAGLSRLGMDERITQYLSKEEGGMLHAVGQGALGLEIRADDDVAKEMVSKIACERTTRACMVERSLLRTLEGGCSVPIGVETEWKKPKRGLATGSEPAKEYDLEGKGVKEEEVEDLDNEDLVTRTVVVSVDGQTFVEEEMVRKVRSVEEAVAMGTDIGKILLKRGADKILEKISTEKMWEARKKLEETK